MLNFQHFIEISNFYFMDTHFKNFFKILTSEATMVRPPIFTYFNIP